MKTYIYPEALDSKPALKASNGKRMHDNRMALESKKGIAALIGMVLVTCSMPIFAESAPVYDADSMQQQFDNAGTESTQDLPPPPPPEQEGAFVPNPMPSAAPAPTVSVSSPSTANLSMEQRMRRAEQQLTNLQTGDTNARMDSLQTQVQTLRGQVEQLTRQIEQIQTQQKAQYSDIDKRLLQQSSKQQAAAAAADMGMPYTTEAANSTDKANRKQPRPALKTVEPMPEASVVTPAVKPVTPATNSTQPDVAEEQQIYQTAYNMIKAKKYSDAVDALKKMLQKYPSGQFASNAHYWLGELYGLMSKNDEALSEFSTVVKSYPDSPRISDAQLKVGLIYAAQSKWPEAKSAFKKVVSRYPSTASARLASEQLKQIKQAGH